MISYYYISSIVACDDAAKGSFLPATAAAVSSMFTRDFCLQINFSYISLNEGA